MKTRHLKKDRKGRIHTWDARDYAGNSSSQLKWAQDLITKISFQKTDTLLDIGCGDGKITALLAKKLPHGSVIGVDASSEMIKAASSAYPLTFKQMDARDLKFENDFDIVFSNSTLHWIEDHHAVLKGIHKALKPNGKVYLKFAGKGNARNLISVTEDLIQKKEWTPYFQNYQETWFFYEADVYKKWLVEAGFTPICVELLPQSMQYSDKTGLEGWIRTVWHSYLSYIPQKKKQAFISELVEQYLKKYPRDENGLINVEMVRLEVMAEKPSKIIVPE